MMRCLLACLALIVFARADYIDYVLDVAEKEVMFLSV